MKRSLPAVIANLIKSQRLLLSVIVSCLSILTSQGQATINADIEITGLTLTPVDQTNFIYSFTLTNNGTSVVNGYSMRLTFSTDDTADPSDYFQITIPSSSLGGQYIGVGQSLLKNEHFYATVPTQYLPSGTWYVIADINYDRSFEESTYDNNILPSSNTITVAPYQIGFSVLPKIESVTDSTFTLKGTLDSRISLFYYKYQTQGLPEPDKLTMRASEQLYPWLPQAIISNLGPAMPFDVYCMGESYDGNTTAIYKLTVTTTGVLAPTIRLNKSATTLEPTPLNKSSLEDFFFVSGYHLADDVIITADENFVVSKDGVAYANQISYLIGDFVTAASHPVFVKATTISEAGLIKGVVSCKTPGAKTKNLAIQISVFDPRDGDFDGLTSLSELGWSTYSVLGPQIWSLVDLDKTSINQRTQGNNMAIQIDGAEHGKAVNEDWLISPAVDLSTFVYYPNVHFKSYSSGEGLPLKLKYSSDFTGYGDPRGATWFDVDVDFAAINAQSWKESSAEVLNNQNTLYFAFVYSSTAQEATKWTVDNWRITDNLTNIPADILKYEGTEVGTLSPSQTIFVELAGYGDVTVTASAGFKISLDNTNFGQSITIPESEALSGKTLFISFAPSKVVNNLNGTLTVSGNDLSASRTVMVGSSLQTTAAETRLATTGFIYPNPTNGAVHVDIDKFDDASTVMPVMISNSIGATVSAFEATDTSVDTKLSDVLTTLSPGIYYITIKSAGVTYRNKVIRK